MPNWCFTTGDIIFKRKKDASLVMNELDKVKEYTRSDFGRLWLGNILMHTGMSRDEIDEKNISCRGSIDWYDRNGDKMISFDEETAWAPMLKCIDIFVRHYTDDFRIRYTAEEPGQIIYFSNDRDVYGKYRVDIWEPDELPDSICEFEDFAVREQDIKDMLKEALRYRKTDNVSIDTLLKEADEYFGDYMSINKFEYVSVDELE
jgi:hypothetical protein